MMHIFFPSLEKKKKVGAQSTWNTKKTYRIDAIIFSKGINENLDFMRCLYGVCKYNNGYFKMFLV